MSKQRKVFAVAGIVAAALLATVLVASNMAFKLNRTFVGPRPNPPSPGGMTSGTNTLALPFAPPKDLQDPNDVLGDAAALFDDIDGGSGVLEQISRYVRSNDSVEFYTASTGTNFTLTPGEGYLVKVNTDASYLIVGSHDPSLTITLVGPQPDPSPDLTSSGTNLYAYPFHSVASTANELMDEINPDPNTPSPVYAVGRWVSSIDGIELYTGFAGQVDFTLVAGEAYFILVNSDVSFVPAHY